MWTPVNEGAAARSSIAGVGSGPGDGVCAGSALVCVGNAGSASAPALQSSTRRERVTLMMP